MSIFILNMPFAIEKQKAMRIKQDLPPYNVSIYLRTESSERERRRDRNKKKICNYKTVS